MDYKKLLSKNSIIIVSIILSVALSSCSSNVSTEITHIHGLGYTADGQKMLIASHYGLVAYSSGIWKTFEGPAHDYMGFQTVAEGFYSSGHPADGSNLKNPLGVIKSNDEGRTIQTLALAGEADFHVMAVSYNTNVIYAYAVEANSMMESAGLYSSQDDAKTWKKSAANGLTNDITSMAVHPTKPNIIAIGTPSGVLFSSDYGDSFVPYLNDVNVDTVYFAQNDELWLVDSKQNELIVLDHKLDRKRNVQLPLNNNDTVLYVSQHPTREKELVIATKQINVVLSENSGMSWKLILDKGMTIDAR